MPFQAAISTFNSAMTAQLWTCTLSRRPERERAWPGLQEECELWGQGGHQGWLWEIPDYRSNPMVLHWWQANRQWGWRGGGGQTGGTVAGGTSQMERDERCQLSRCVCSTVENTEPQVWGSKLDLIIPSALKWLSKADFLCCCYWALSHFLFLHPLCFCVY